MYIEPDDYFPDADLKKFKLGKYADQSRIDRIIGRSATKPTPKKDAPKKSTKKK